MSVKFLLLQQCQIQPLFHCSPTLIAYCNAKDRKNYKADFKKAMDKNLASLSQEDRNKRKKEILEVIANKKKTMTMKEYREEGLDLHDCACEGPFHDHEKKGKKGKKPSHHQH
ncbi:DUF1104 domain-containing protein [Helicobacter pylori]|nr:DUF1104 domain-containing protein [Helicobacter pylori]UOR75145.1 DUF1104 domain-containing protein [Helicobacter pylori]